MQAPDDSTLLVDLAMVKELLAVEDHLPWDQQSEMLHALKTAVNCIPAVAALPAQRDFILSRALEMRVRSVKDFVHQGLGFDRTVRELKSKRAELEDAGVIGPAELHRLWTAQIDGAPAAQSDEV